MKPQSWLISWIGGTDHECAEGKHGKDLGPIATALTGKVRYDRVYLLTNYDHQRSERFCRWLQEKAAYESDKVDLFDITLSSPIDYAQIYEQVSQNLTAALLPKDDIQITFHLSPGTPAMQAIWIILAKTRFPAKLIQTSKERGLQEVNFFIDLANDYLPEFLRRGGERATRLAIAAKTTSPEFSKIIHKSKIVEEQIELARRIAAFDVPVLILGETGTGKELFAEAIHAASSRAGKPFLAVNCGAIQPELANSELFGHKKGSFTGATTDRKGHFQEAEGGTLFLDEVGELPLDTQARLLRALQSKEITQLGQSRSITVNARIIAATHRDLSADVATGRFREDLFHRLAVGILRLPPLRDRDGDLEELIDYFIDLINSDGMGRPEAPHKKISKGAISLLQMHPWPGNIRELYHTLMRSAIWSLDAEISADDIRASLLPVTQKDGGVLDRQIGKSFDLEALLDEVARRYIGKALARSGNRKTAAAKLLGFKNYQTFGNWMKRLAVENEGTIE